MLKYKYTVTGQSKEDGNFYKQECFVNGMSKYELDVWIKKLNFKPETVKVKKEKIK